MFMPRMPRAVSVFSAALSAAAAMVCMLATTANAQYYESKVSSRTVLEQGRIDSVIVERVTPFSLPAVPDSVELTYHEPMPDSIMPASAIVIGTISFQMEKYSDITPKLEEYARKNGADWIVSFTEPHGIKRQNGDRFYRATATLMKVLDPTLVEESKLKYAYYEDNHLDNLAALQQYLDKQTMMGHVDPDFPGDESGNSADDPADH